MNDQSDGDEQFYLYSVRLRPDVPICPGSIPDSSNVWGDVWIDEVASPGVDVVRYVNVHEDPARLSAAIRPSAIAATQRLPIPLAVVDDDPWVADATSKLQSSSLEPTPLPAFLSAFPIFYTETYRSKAAEELAKDLAARLPATMEHQFKSAVRWEDGDDPADWSRWVKSLFALVEDAERVLDELEVQPVRRL